MKKFSGYENVKANNFDNYEKLEVGGHYVKILDVNEITINGKTSPFNQLEIKIDICEPDEQAGYYARKFKQDADKDALNAKWKGYYKLNVPKDDGSEQDEKTKSAFKTFITYIEKSNSGYDWEKANWDEKTLIGKTFVGVFGIEEFENMAGEIVYTTKCKFCRSTDTDMSKISIPKVQCADKSYMDYDEWIDKRAEEQGKKSENNLNTVVDDDSDDLPF